MCDMDVLCLRVRKGMLDVVYAFVFVYVTLTCVLLVCCVCTSILYEASVTVCLRAQERVCVVDVCYFPHLFMRVCASFLSLYK